MRFDSDKAFRQLIERGIVATMRMNRKVRIGNRYGDLYVKGMIVNIVRNGKRVARGVILDVIPNTPENRARYVSISGFDTVDEWEREAIRLHGRLPNSIVVVRLLAGSRKAYKPFSQL